MDPRYSVMDPRYSVLGRVYDSVLGRVYDSVLGRVSGTLYMGVWDGYLGPCIWESGTGLCMGWALAIPRWVLAGYTPAPPRVHPPARYTPARTQGAPASTDLNA